MTKELKTTMARMNIEINVDCPYCEYHFDILEETELNDEGYVLSQATPDGLWGDAHREFELEEVECPECDRVFTVKQLEW